MSIAPISFSPVSLSYIAALRGFKPRRPGEAFTYALVNCPSPELLIGLAASNPEGQFYGLTGDVDGQQCSVFGCEAIRPAQRPFRVAGT
jgi:hypothetical protein